MLEKYPEVNDELLDDSCDKEINLLFNIIKEVRNYKISNKLAPNKCLDLTIKLKIDVGEGFETYLKRFTFSNIKFVDGEIINMSGDLINLDYCDILISNDSDKEEIRARIEKDIETEQNEIQRCQRMLENPNFIAKAPKEKIDQEKAKLELHKSKLLDLQEKLKKL